jgi:hypothetical protein
MIRTQNLSDGYILYIRVVRLQTDQVLGSNCAECPYLNCRHNTTTAIRQAPSCRIARWVQWGL